ncbi:MAG: adenosine deaminase [Lachnospiraceae bacterium]|nr:adenosine deaminase [Lachnospiraceae bacterium]MDY5741371.1 adenosine deaminase [Lachnospiraceae bacterium]
MQINNTCTLPRIDLHCHLDGSLTQSCVSELLGRTVSPAELQVADDCRDLATYLEKFQLPLRCLQTKEGLYKAAETFLLSLQDDGVRYVEVRFAPLLSTHANLSCRSVIEAVLEGLKSAHVHCGIHYNVIVCAMRHHTDEQNIAMLRVAREYLGRGVCAADLAGNEAAYPMEDFIDVFREAKRLDFPFTIHAGECGRVENIIEAIELGATRIGHGIAMQGKPQVQELVRRRHIGIEMCPISNGQTKAVEDMRCYPLREFLTAGVPVTINTDNRTVSHTSLKTEFDFVRSQYHITEQEIRQMTNTAIEVAYADDSVKHKLWLSC